MDIAEATYADTGEDTPEQLEELPRLFIVVPCYNEEEVLPTTLPMFLSQMEHMVSARKVAADSRLLFVDDGSTDGTWQFLSDAAHADKRVLAIRQSRNRGHQSSLLAGLMEARHYADVVISCDCDGQDDLSCMEQMIDRYLDGCEVVYGVRSSRASDAAGKRGSAKLFYRLMNWLGAETIPDHADYRLASGEVLDALAEYGEVNLYLRGIFPLMGFKSDIVYYERKERIAGESKYSLGKMVGLALAGITSMSIQPIRIIGLVGAFTSLLALVGMIWAFVTAVTGNAVSGWASTIMIVLFIGGIQLLSLGVIGEYVGKTYLEAKHRPRYIIDARVGTDPTRRGNS